jgi:hypothetical protein
VALKRLRIQSAAFLCLFAFQLTAATTRAQTPLKTINNPGGGTIVYGHVDGQSTEPGAMGAILRVLHNQNGDRPQVGRVFRVNGTNSVAIFFTLVKRNQGNAQIAGMLIASKVSDTNVEAALVTDDASRFGTTINPMLKTLFTEWHPGGANGAGPGRSAASAGYAPTVAPLHQYVLPDRSAAVSLPDGWQVSPTSGGGTIIATGPNGEAVSLGYPFLAMDSRNPRVQQTMRAVQQGGLRNTAYAKGLYYPYGADLGKTLVDLNRMKRQMAGMSVPTMTISSETPLPGGGSDRCAHLLGQIDANDGKGPLEMDSVYCMGPLSPMGQYGSVVYHTAVPVALANKERATMGAVLASFSEDMNVVNSEAAAIAKPAIDHIHAIGRAAAQQAATAHAMNDAHNASVEAHWDSMDRQSQGFSNYLLDQTVIQDNNTGTHQTVWNKAADDMVKHDPERYQYVNTPDYWKGVDY